MNEMFSVESDKFESSALLFAKIFMEVLMLLVKLVN